MKTYIKAPYLYSGFSGNVLDFSFGSNQTKINNFALQKALLKVAEFLIIPRSLNEIENFIHINNFLSLKRKILNLLLTKNYIIPTDEYDKNERFSRQGLFYRLSGKNPKIVQENLSHKHAVILGCGGIGNIISVNLATAGIGKLTLIDNDKIEISNLTRQILYTEEMIGKSKTLHLREELLKRASDIKINIIDELINSKEKIATIPECDVIIVSGDSENLIYYINEVCYERKIPFINVGYIQDISVWGPFIIPNKTACFLCFAKKYISNSKPDSELINIQKNINKHYQAPSIGPVNMLSGAMASLDILKFLGGFGDISSLNKRMGIWTHDLHIEEQYYIHEQDCQICKNI